MPGNLEAPAAQPGAEDPAAPAPAAVPALPLEIWRVLGDCRCLFRAVVRSRFLDPCNKIQRDLKGNPLEEKQRIKECQYAESW